MLSTHAFTLYLLACAWLALVLGAPLPLSETVAVGIDLGTTRSVIAVYVKGNTVVITHDNLQKSLPSCVAWLETGEQSVGDYCLSLAQKNPTRVVMNSKRILGRMYNDPSVSADAAWMTANVVNNRGRPAFSVGVRPCPANCTANGKPVAFENTLISPELISAILLKQLKAAAEKQLGFAIKYAVVSVPAYFTEAQLEATMVAARLAGLEVLQLLKEPTAAGIAYGTDANGLGAGNSKTIAVYDFGGGTLDVTIMKLTNGESIVIATHGNSTLGGESFNQRLMGYVRKEVQAEQGVDLMKDPVAMQLMRREVERAKLELSGKLVSTVSFSTGTGINVNVRITRPQFEALCKDLFEAAQRTFLTCLKDAKLTVADLDELLLVGGSSIIPRVQSDLEKAYGRPLNHGVDKSEAVGIGAAIMAASLLQAMGHLPNSGTNSNTPHIVAVDVTPLPLGVGSVTHPEFHADRNGEPVPVPHHLLNMSVIVDANSRIPFTFTGSYGTRYDNQTSLLFSVYEGPHTIASANEKLGELTLSGIPASPRGRSVSVTFTVNENGLLNVTAKDVTSGLKMSAVIKKAWGGGVSESPQPAGASGSSTDPLESEKRVLAWLSKNQACVERRVSAGLQFDQALMDAEDDSAHPGHGLVEEMRTWSTSATTKDCASASEYEERTALLKEGRRGGSTGA